MILYTTHCPKCQVLKTKLQEKGFDHKEVTDIEEFTRLGIETVPVLELEDGRLLNFKEAIDYISDLWEQVGYEN